MVDRWLRQHHAVIMPGVPVPVEMPVAYCRSAFDPIDLLACPAGRTPRILLGTSAINVLYHPPVLLARRLANLDPDQLVRQAVRARADLLAVPTVSTVRVEAKCQPSASATHRCSPWSSFWPLRSMRRAASSARVWVHATVRFRSAPAASAKSCSWRRSCRAGDELSRRRRSPGQLPGQGATDRDGVLGGRHIEGAAVIQSLEQLGLRWAVAVEQAYRTMAVPGRQHVGFPVPLASGIGEFQHRWPLAIDLHRDDDTSETRPGRSRDGQRPASAHLLGQPGEWITPGTRRLAEGPDHAHPQSGRHFDRPSAHHLGTLVARQRTSPLSTAAIDLPAPTPDRRCGAYPAAVLMPARDPKSRYRPGPSTWRGIVLAALSLRGHPGRRDRGGDEQE